METIIVPADALVAAEWTPDSIRAPHRGRDAARDNDRFPQRG
jgi:hypothetical protein